MLIVWLKRREEFQKVCQGKVVFFSADASSLTYFSPAQVNEAEILYAFSSEVPLPFREHYDLQDEDGIHVWQLVEVEGLSCPDLSGNITNSETRLTEEAKVY